MTALLRDLIRGVLGNEGRGFVATFGGRGVFLRPKRVRDPDAEVYLTWDQIYHHGLMRRVKPIAKRRKTR